MREIKLIDSGELKARHMLKQIAMIPAKGEAVTYEQMGRRMKIIDALDALSEEADVLLLEDSVWTTLKAAAEVFPFAVAHPDLYTFVRDYIMGAETVNVVPAPAK
jgi:hypothetical protein